MEYGTLDALDRTTALGAARKGFRGIVVSAAFEGKPKVRQHQAVYGTLGRLMGNEIHALQLQTFAPAQWEEGRGELGM